MLTVAERRPPDRDHHSPTPAQDGSWGLAVAVAACTQAPRTAAAGTDGSRREHRIQVTENLIALMHPPGRNGAGLWRVAARHLGAYSL
jgi:hypothetical protein